jgi:hypothetical protein
MKQSNITHEDYDELKLAYFKAIEEGAKLFHFKDNEIVTTYAKYILEYMEQQKKNIS